MGDADGVLLIFFANFRLEYQAGPNPWTEYHAGPDFWKKMLDLIITNVLDLLQSHLFLLFSNLISGRPQSSDRRKFRPGFSDP